MQHARRLQLRAAVGCFAPVARCGASTGEGRIALIHPDDIADVITRVLTSAEHWGRALPITGPRALSYAEMTAALATALARPLRFEAISDERLAPSSSATGCLKSSPRAW